MELHYYVPFKATEGQNADLALKESLLNIEGIAIDTSVNKNKWQVPEEDLDYFVKTLIGAQLRIDHGESVIAVVGKVPEAKNLGDSVYFRAELGDAGIIQKVLRSYVGNVSVQVDSDDVACSTCGKQTRKEGLLVHLCAGAWEIVHKPKVRELSIVASPAYEHTTFKPAGFAAAMNESQRIDLSCGSCSRNTGKHRLLMKADFEEEKLKEKEREKAGSEAETKLLQGQRLTAMKQALTAKIHVLSQSLFESDDGGSRGDSQEPDEKKPNINGEVKP